MLHLRTLNPLIVGVLDMMPEQAAGRGTMSARQPAPMASCSAQHAISSSVSSFAFMGTNANVIMQTSFSISSSTATIVGPKTQQLSWVRARSWVAPPVGLLAARALSVSTGGQVVLQADLSAVQMSFLWDHQVAGSVVFPGAGYFLAAAAAADALLPAAAGSQLALQDATIPAPLVLPSSWQDIRGEMPMLQVVVDTTSSSVSISSVSSISSLPGLTHFSSRFATVAQATRAAHSSGSSATTAVAAPAWLKALAASVAGAAAESSQGYAPGATAAIAASQHNDGSGHLDVGVFDSWLQAGQVFILKEMAKGGVYVPASVDLVFLPSSNSSSSSSGGMLAYVQPHVTASSSKQAVSDYTLMGVDGAACSIMGMTAKPIASSRSAGAAAAAPAPAAAQQAAPELLYEVQWQALDADTAAAEQRLGKFAVSSSSEAGALAAVQSLINQQQHVSLTGAAPVALDGGLAGMSTAAAAAVGGNAVEAAAAMLRCVSQEQPGLQLCVLQHSSYSTSSTNTAMLLPGSSTSSDVFGSFSSAGVLSQPRLLPALAASQVPHSFQLMPLARGSLDSLTPVPVTNWPDFSSSNSSAGLVLVKVAAVGINFRDVLNVLGMYPGDPGAPGSDFSGHVVSGPMAGSAVLGLSTGALASHVVASVQTVAPMPATVSFEAAATVPTVFTTAHAAVRQLAGLRAGESVLVHGAAGGVGLAAIQAAAAVGAAVYGTAGSSTKRHLLRTLGCNVAVGSRDTVFASEVLLAGGVDVVLNSLTSPGMVGGSLAVLKQGGRFVEIGKRDIWAPAAVAAERPDVSLCLLAIDFMPPAVLQQLLLQVSSDLATGKVAPIRAAVHDTAAVHAAMRQMAQARHVGKVVVSAHAARMLPSSSTGRSSSSSSSSMGTNAASNAGGNVLVTGGTGALGQLVCSWLSIQQVQHMTLCSRTGKLSNNSTLPLTDANHPLHSSMVSITSCDVSIRSDVGGLFAGVMSSNSANRPALSAIMHAGGVLADAAIANQTAASMRAVAAAKSVALQLLMQRLVPLPVVSNVLFSSMAALLGSAGQSNYAASNAALDAAARQLQGAGLCAISVQFSAWAGAGMAAATAGKVDAMGIGALSPTAGLSALEAAVQFGASTTR
jgi:NADPH:quinone reductase-like Zn-dependent oxidoreductase